jgi:hypothetical protein
MKLLFLALAIFILVLSVKAERPGQQFTCQVSHKYYQTAFYLEVPEKKNFSLGPWELEAEIHEVKEELQVSLKRIVTIMDATYEKTTREVYPHGTILMPVTLEHPFGGKVDIFNMTCYPRDP